MSDDKETLAVEYQGRKPSRSNSEQRRRAILEAALRIVIREGVRGVRHRAVAKEANVPLSATTYYFKDISDLITDTFILFAENALANVIEPFGINLKQHFAPIGTKDPVATVKHMCQFLENHILYELEHHREHLLAEHAFLHEALRDERLHPLVHQYRSKLVSDINQIISDLSNIPDAESSAWLMLTALLQIEYELLFEPIDAIDREQLRERLRFVLSVTFKIGL